MPMPVAMTTMRPRCCLMKWGSAACISQSAPSAPCREQIHVGLGDRFERGDRAERLGVGDEAIESAEAFDGGGDDAMALGVLADVPGDGEVFDTEVGEFGRCGVEAFLAAAGDDDRCAVAVKVTGDAETDPRLPPVMMTTRPSTLLLADAAGVPVAVTALLACRHRPEW